MFDIIKNFFSSLNIFDAVFFLIMTYSILQCFAKGFSLSFISFMKWVLSTIITILLVPKFQPWVSEYIKSDFINSVGLGVIIFIISLFIIILIGKSVNRAVTWTGLGSVDKTFGLFFGLFKGYIVCVCLFTVLNWFYPYQNWGISSEKALSFNIVKNGSELLINEFPSDKHFIDTKEKIEEI